MVAFASQFLTSSLISPVYLARDIAGDSLSQPTQAGLCCRHLFESQTRENTEAVVCCSCKAGHGLRVSDYISAGWSDCGVDGGSMLKAGMSKSGVVKNWNEDKGFGFIGRIGQRLNARRMHAALCQQKGSPGVS